MDSSIRLEEEDTLHGLLDHGPVARLALPQGLLRSAAVANVAAYAHEPLYLAPDTEQGHLGGREPAPLAGGGPDPLLAVRQRLAQLHHPPVVLQKRCGLVAPQVGVGLTERRLLRSEPQRLQVPPVVEQEAVLTILDEDGVVRTLHYRSEQTALVGERPLGPPATRHVPVDPHMPRTPAVRIHGGVVSLQEPAVGHR